MMPTHLSSNAAMPPNVLSTEPEKSPGGALAPLSAFGAIAGGILASTCCILPLVMVSIGVGGAWMSNLTALAPYQNYFLSIAGISVAGGFWVSYKARRSACAISGPCGETKAKKRYTIGLWVGAVMALSAIAANFVGPLFY